MKRFSILFLIPLFLIPLSLIEINAENIFSQTFQNALISHYDLKNWRGSAQTQPSRKISSEQIAALSQAGNEVDVGAICGNRTDLEISKAIKSIGTNNATLLLASGSWQINNSIGPAKPS